MRKLVSILLLFFAIQSLAQTGPAGIGTSDGTSFLKVWLDANKLVAKDLQGKTSASDKERAMFWADLSGNGNHVTITQDSSRPTLFTNLAFLNNQNALRFNKDGDVGNRSNYMTTSSFSKSTDITIYCVFQAISRAGGNNITPFQVKYGDQNMWYSGAGLVDADAPGRTLNDISLSLTDTSIAAGCGDSITQYNYTVKTPVFLNRPNIGTMSKVASTGILSVSKNGQRAVEYQSGKSPVSSGVRYVIGADNTRDKRDSYFDGYMSTVLVFNKYLSEAERIILNNYLSAKYLIPLVQNDLFKMDEVLMGNYDFEMAAIGMGNDNLTQSKAKGEGLVEVSNPTNLERNEYLFWAHNNQALSFQVQDVPEGVKHRLARTWRVSEIGETGLVDLVIDTKSFPEIDQELVLLVDTDNNGLFENESLGNGMKVQSKYLGQGRFLFQNVNLNNENRFTFAALKPACTSDCDAVFTPNGDGNSDTYLIENMGKVAILDKFGQLVKELNGPSYWDGTKSNGTLATEGLYFIVSNDARQKTVTLLK